MQKDHSLFLQHPRARVKRRKQEQGHLRNVYIHFLCVQVNRFIRCQLEGLLFTYAREFISLQYVESLCPLRHPQTRVSEKQAKQTSLLWEHPTPHFV